MNATSFFKIYELDDGKWQVLSQDVDGTISEVFDNLVQAENWIKLHRSTFYSVRSKDPFGSDWEVVRITNNNTPVTVFTYDNEGSALRIARMLQKEHMYEVTGKCIFTTKS